MIFQFSVNEKQSSRPEVFLRKVFWKYVVKLKKNTHAEVWFQ